jgi:hypothetical protein
VLGQGRFRQQVCRLPRVKSQPRHDFWEIFRESDRKHTIDPDLYNRIYDAVTEATYEIFQFTQFVGPALSMRNVTPVQSFLEPANHQAGTPGLDQRPALRDTRQVHHAE